MARIPKTPIAAPAPLTETSRKGRILTSGEESIGRRPFKSISRSSVRTDPYLRFKQAQRELPNSGHSPSRIRSLSLFASRIEIIGPGLHALDNIGQAVVGGRFPFALILLPLRAAGGLLALLVQPLHFLL